MSSLQIKEGQDVDNCWMYSWNNACEAGNELALMLGVRKIAHTNSQFRGNANRTVINWGSSQLPDTVLRCRIINKPDAVLGSVDKVRFFRRTYGRCHTVPWTTDRWEASKWLADGHKVVCRTRTTGREGAGIVIAEPRSPAGGNLGTAKGVLAWLLNARPGGSTGLPEARLYTRFIPDTTEYRVHVVAGEVIAVHRKVGGTDESVRNTANGWLFRRVTTYPRAVGVEATRAVAALELDFAAIDTLWDGTSCWVLESNTAPGIDGMYWTTRKYGEALEALVERG